MAICIGAVAVFQFIRVRTTVNPHMPQKANKLVTGGLYRFSRNPMYLGMLLALLALGLQLGNAFNTIVAALFVSYMNRFQILPEERMLTSIFGDDYRRYCSKVRRWF
ncbi:MAG: isoprenylcysteine carboxylmethyltransferase family protein [Flavobacteriaceae bacterium]